MKTKYKKILEFFMIFSAICLLLSESISLTTTLFEKISYVAFASAYIALLVPSITVRDLRGNKKWNYLILAMVFYSCIYPFFSGSFNVYYYMRDLIVVMIVFTSGWILNKYSIVNDRDFWFKSLVALFILALLSFGVHISINSARFEPPEIAIIPLAFLFFFESRKAATKLLCVSIVGMAVYLSFASGQRASFLISIFSVILCGAIFSSSRKLSLVLGVFSIVVLFFGIQQLQILDSLQGTRFERVVNGQIDGSIGARILEIEDVLINFDGAGIAQKIFGFGLGAMYAPISVASEKHLVFTNNGPMLFQIHSTPFYMLLKLGVVGFLVYVVSLLFSLRRIVGMLTFGSKNRFLSLLDICILLYLVNGIFFLLPYEPVFWILVATKFMTIRNEMKNST